MSTNSDTNLYLTTLAPQLAPAAVQQAMALITPARRIALLAHERPDGDCLGSALGLAHILRQLNKVCIAACADPAPRSFAFMPGIEDLQTTLGDENFDLVIALDAGELTRYGALYTQHQAFLDQATILNIDHHVSSLGCGQVNIIDPSAAATTELLVLLQQQAELPLTREAAVCLLTGLITDTGSFQYTSTTARTMMAGAALLSAGATAEEIVKPIFHVRPLAEARFQALALLQAQTACEGRLIWSYATEETRATTGLQPDMDHNCSGRLRDIEGVQISAFFSTDDSPTETRVSMRSNAPYDVAAVAMHFGGGGHSRAAGATIALPLQDAMDAVITELKHIIQEIDTIPAS